MLGKSSALLTTIAPIGWPFILHTPCLISYHTIPQRPVLTFNRAKLAPSSIRPAGIHIAPINAAASSIKLKGGFPSGALGILVPVHPSVCVNSALRGGISAHGMDTITANEMGMRKLLRIMTSRLSGVMRLMEVRGDAGL
jgi:hypothetical protein